MAFDSHTKILTFSELSEITGYQRAGDLENYLRRQGIPFFPSRRGPWTTLDLVNATKGLREIEASNQEDLL